MWGVWADDKAEKLWNDLDRKFNRELPRLDAELGSLLKANPKAAGLITDVRDDVAKMVAENDGDIHRDKADQLNAALDAVIDRVQQTERAVAEERRQAIEELIPRRLTALGQLGVVDKDLVRRRKGMLSEVTLLAKAGPDEVFDRSGWFKRLRQLESDFRKEHQEQARNKRERETEQAEQQRLKNLGTAEQARRTKVLGEIQRKLPQYGRSLTLCGGDVDLLDQLVRQMAVGEGGKLEECLRWADAADVLALLGVHRSSVTHVKELLEAWGGGAIRPLQKMVAQAGPGNEARLVAVIAAAKAHEHGDVVDLLGRVDVTTLEKLVKLGSVTQLTSLFVTRQVDVTETKTLLGSASGNDTVLLLSKVPDPKLVNGIRVLGPSAPELVALVSDLGHDPTAVGATRRLLARGGATLLQVKGLREVEEARGLRTNAGALIPERAVNTLPAAEAAAVTAGLAGIDSGKPPVLTHPNGAKFGDTFDNNAGRLPGVAGAAGYKEYYVEKDPASLTYHGDRRLVVSNRTAHVYYTADHYASFCRIR